MPEANTKQSSAQKDYGVSAILGALGGATGAGFESGQTTLGWTAAALLGLTAVFGAVKDAPVKPGQMLLAFALAIGAVSAGPAALEGARDLSTKVQNALTPTITP